MIIALPSFSQEEEKLKKLENLENKTDSVTDNDSTVFEIGDKVISIKENGDETNIKIGNKEIHIVGKKDEDFDWNSNKTDEKNYKHGRRFRGHLGGIEFGFNGYLTDFWSTSLKTIRLLS